MTETERPARSKDTSHKPADKHGLRISKFLNDKTGGGEYSGTHHIGNDQDGYWKKTDLSFELVVVKVVFQFDFPVFFCSDPYCIQIENCAIRAIRI